MVPGGTVTVHLMHYVCMVNTREPHTVSSHRGKGLLGRGLAPTPPFLLLHKLGPQETQSSLLGHLRKKCRNVTSSFAQTEPEPFFCVRDILECWFMIREMPAW